MGIRNIIERAQPIPTRLDSAILLPRPLLVSDPNVVASATVQKLATNPRINRVTRPEIWRPNVNPRKVFQDLGFNVESPTAGRRVLASGQALVHPLDNLGGYVVYGPRDGLNLEPLQDELGDEFVIVRDYRVFQENQDAPYAINGDIGDTAWPEISGIQRARELEVDGRQVRFGIVDTGIDADHAEFTRRKVAFAHVPYREDLPLIDRRRGSDPWGHGTHVASIVAGRNVGVARESRLFVAAVADGHSLTSHMRRIISGLDWLLGVMVEKQSQGFPIILNLSLGFEHAPAEGEDPAEYAMGMQALESAITAFTDGNVLVVAAIGNDSEGRYRLPAGMQEVLAVGAADETGEEVMHFSGNVPAECDAGHAGPDLLGLGENVLGADGRNVYGASLYSHLSGTSQATAYVAGLAGLYWSMDRRMTAGDVRDMLIGTAKRPRGQSARRWGAGLARFQPDKKLVKTWTDDI